MKKILVALFLAVLLPVNASALMVMVKVVPMEERPDLSQEEKLQGLEAYGDVIFVFDDSYVMSDPRLGNAECWKWPFSNGGDRGCIYVSGVTYAEAEAWALDRSAEDEVTGLPTISRNYFVMLDAMTGQSLPQLLQGGQTEQTWAKMKNWFCNKTTGLTPGGKTCP